MEFPSSMDLPYKTAVNGTDFVVYNKLLCLTVSLYQRT